MCTRSETKRQRQLKDKHSELSENFKRVAYVKIFLNLSLQRFRVRKDDTNTERL